MLPPPARLSPTAIAAFGVIATVVGTGCPGNLDPAFYATSDGVGNGGAGAGGGDGTACDAPAAMVQNCASSTCHVPGGLLGAGLDLSTDQAAHLLGVASPGATGSECGAGIIYLNRHTSPATGLFIDKLDAPTCGTQMPFETIWKRADDHACVVQWANTLTAP